MVIGNSFVKFIRVMARAGGDALAAAELARKDYGNDSPTLSLCQKAIIVDTSSLGGDAGFRAAMNDFLIGVQSYDLLARINALVPLHTVPLRTRVLVEDEEPVASWIAEGALKVPSSASFEEVTITPSKAVGLLVCTQELLKLTTDAAERALTRSLQRSVAKITSSAVFALSTDAGAPASLLTNATEVVSTGDVTADMAALVKAFQGDVSRAVLITSSNNAMALALQGFGPDDGFGVNGGTIFGLPCVASPDVSDSVVVLADASEILYGDDGIRVDVSTQTVVTVDDVQVSLWQKNLAAMLCERFVAWQAVPGTIAYLSNVTWAGDNGGTT